MKQIYLALSLLVLTATAAQATVTINAFQAKTFGTVTVCQMIVTSDEGVDLAQCVLPNGQVLNPSSSSQNGNTFGFYFTTSGNGGIVVGSSVDGLVLGSQGGVDGKSAPCTAQGSLVYCR